MAEDEKRQFDDAAHAPLGAESELIAAMQNFVDAQAKAGKSKGHALDILRQLLRKSREEKAERLRAAFKVVESTN
jgi:hypothetical protein